MSSTINEKGCLLAGEEWLEKNLIVVAGVAVGIAFLQVRTLFFSYFCAFGYFPFLPTRGIPREFPGCFLGIFL